MCAQAAAALECPEKVPERMLSFCAAPEALRANILDLYDGGGPSRWPTAAADSDVLECEPDDASRSSSRAVGAHSRARHRDKLLYSSDNTAAAAPAVAHWLVTHSAAARGFEADTLARAAVIFSLNAHDVHHPQDESKNVPALFEFSSKFSHSCDPNTKYSLSDGDKLTHTTLRDVAPGEVLTVSYFPRSRWSTTVRRHLLARGKFFECGCMRCTAPDWFAALPCPSCVPRGADGTVPLERLFISPADAADWRHPKYVSLREQISTVVAEGGGASPTCWCCSTCGGVFSHAFMARITIADGVRRPLPRSSVLSSRFGAASLLDVARWAEGFSFIFITVHEKALDADDEVVFAPCPPGGVADEMVPQLNTCINELAALVGPWHASVLALRLQRLRNTLRGAFRRGCAVTARPDARHHVAAEVRRLLGAHDGSAAARAQASLLLLSEMGWLLQTLRRARLPGLEPKMVVHFACVMAALGALEDKNFAQCVREEGAATS